MPVTISTLMRQKNGELVDHREYAEEIRDRLYIEGAIVLDCHGTKVLDERMWDLVDQLWAYLVAGAEELQQARRFSTYFPDQPIELTMRHVGHRGEVLISTNLEGAPQAVVQEDELLAELAKKGSEFLAWLGTVTPIDANLQKRAARLHPTR